MLGYRALYGKVKIWNKQISPVVCLQVTMIWREFPVTLNAEDNY